MLFLALTGAFARPAAAAPRVAVVSTSGSTIIVGAREKVDTSRGRKQIEGSVSTAAERAGAQLVGSDQLAKAGLAECIAAECIKKIGTATGASYVLVVDGSLIQDVFKFRLEMWGTAAGDHVDGDGGECDGCSIGEFLTALQDRTKALCERVFKKGTPPVPALATVPTPSAPANPPPALVTAPPAVSTGSSGDRWPPRWAGWTLVGAGAAAAAAGGYLLAINGDAGQCEQPPMGGPQVCPAVHNTKAGGIALTAAGGLALAGGVVILLHDFGESHLALGVGPDQIAFSGRF